MLRKKMWLLETKAVPALREWAGIPPEDESALTTLVARVRKDKALSALYEQGTDLLYEKNENGEYESLNAWQPPVGEEAGLCLLLALACLPSVRVAHALRHVDERITRDTCRDVGAAAERWKAVYATPEQPLGIERWLLSWFRLIGSGELYRLGRLQFARGTFDGAIVGFRERATGNIALLAAAGATFDAAGYRTDVDTPGGWQAMLLEGGQAFTGSVISSRGLATKETWVLPRTDWEPFLRAGDPIVEIHIPEGDPLESAACRESIAAARSFFSAKYPQTPPPKAFVCSSWLLDPAWQGRLDEDSNIVRFQKEGVLYPVRTGRREGVYYIFYSNQPNPETARRKTRIEQIMLEALEREEPLRAGGMLIPY